MKDSTFHIGLNVSDVNKSIGFYNQLFGTPPTKQKKIMLNYELKDLNLVISFIQSPNVSPGFGHMGFRTESESNYRQLLEVFKTKGIIDAIEEETACCYARQDKFWLKDPDGHAWEVYHFIDDIEQLAAVNVGCCVSN